MESLPIVNNMSYHLMERTFLMDDVHALVKQLTIEEKKALLAGYGWWRRASILNLAVMIFAIH